VSAPLRNCDGFAVTRFARWLIARSLPGLAAIAAAHEGRVLLAGALLVVAAAADLAVESLAGRRGWVRGPSETQIEGFVDFVCFVWAPIAFVWSIGRPLWLWVPGAVFVLAGVLRLARFNVEGMVNGGYRGVPVTYNAVLLPLAQLLLAPLGVGTVSLALAVLLLLTAALMTSSRIIVPRVAL